MQEMPSIPAVQEKAPDQEKLVLSARTLAESRESLEQIQSLQDGHDRGADRMGDQSDKKQMHEEIEVNSKKQAIQNLTEAVSVLGLRPVVLDGKEKIVETSSRPKNVFLVFEDKSRFLSSVETLVNEIKANGETKEAAVNGLKVILDEYVAMLGELRVQTELIPEMLDEMNAVKEVANLLEGTVNHLEFQKIVDAITNKQF